MPRAEAGTPKAIANQMKSRGLQKLRWYCQMCEKQCRDENGFRNHLTTEGHKRQMKLFSENSGRIVENHSKEFMNGFLSILSRRYGSNRVFANRVYQEYISDKQHMHMNATRWATLTEFVMYLTRRGLIKAEEGDGGWYITWIDNSPNELARKDAIRRQEAMKKDQEERDRLLIEEQVERGKEKQENTERPLEEFKRDETKKIQIAFQPKILAMTKQKKLKKAFGDEVEEASSSKRPAEEDAPPAAKKQPEEEKPWILPGIIVKITSQKLADGAYLGKKGEVLRVFDEFVAEVKMFDSKDVVRIDQVYLETVIPPVGRDVLLLGEPHRGKRAELKEVDLDALTATVQLQDGNEMSGIEFEWLSKAL